MNEWKLKTNKIILNGKYKISLNVGGILENKIKVKKNLPKKF